MKKMIFMNCLLAAVAGENRGWMGMGGEKSPRFPTLLFR
jgi:hypothetical protein